MKLVHFYFIGELSSTTSKIRARIHRWS